MEIKLDQEIAKKLNTGMSGEGAVELPFPVVYFWALNGHASYKQQGGTLYYGGWACKIEDMQALTDQLAIPLPSGLKQVAIASRDGGEFEAYTTRHLIVAPISRRVSWLFDGRRFSEYVEGGRRHLQVLSFLGTQAEDRHIEPWGPVVLTAKGYQARNLLDAFAKWDKGTAQARSKIAPGLPANVFYAAVGTFGKERVSVNVGKPGAQSPITPLTVHIPEKVDEAWMRGLFVGEAVAAAMSEYLDRASDWLKAWKQESGNVDQYEMDKPRNGEPPQPEDVRDEDFPPF